VVLIFKNRYEAWVLNQVEIGLNVQVLHWKTELVDILAREEGCARQVEEQTLFFTT
jgi:hypothetical protein